MLSGRTRTRHIRIISVLATVFLLAGILYFPVNTSATTVVKNTAVNTKWDTDQVLGQKGDYKFAGIHVYDNLTIGDNIRVFSKGISQLVIKVNGTLTLGKNTTICVRNGFFQLAPTNSISRLSSTNLNILGVDGGGFRVYDNMFGKGGNGGKGASGGDGSFGNYLGNSVVGRGGNGGHGGSGGYGGGLGGKGGGYGGPPANSDKVGTAGTNGANNATSNTRDASIEIGQDGKTVDYGGGFSGEGNGGRGGDGAGQRTDMGLGNNGGGGGGGGYGGGILTIIAKHIVFDVENPPKFITSGQVGGTGGRGQGRDGENGANGKGGLLMIYSQDYKYSLNHWNLNDKTYGARVIPSNNGGHGIVTGNPQKVFINDIQIIKGDEVVIVDLPTAIKNATALLNGKVVGIEEGNTTKAAKNSYTAAIKAATTIRDGKYSEEKTDEALTSLKKATTEFNRSIIKPTKVKIGDYIQFGNYLGLPIQWRVINLDAKGCPLLFAEKILCLKAFDGAERFSKADYDRTTFGSNKWENSNLREWLNSMDKKVNYTTQQPDYNSVYSGYNFYYSEAGFLTNFTDNERNLIQPVTNKSILADVDRGEKTGGTEQYKLSGAMSSLTTNYDKAYYKNVTDKVFILDINELHDFVYSRGYSYVRSPAQEVGNVNNFTDSENLGYWLRVPGTASSSYECGIKGDGTIGISPAYFSCYDIRKQNIDGGVVPALYLKSSGFETGDGTVDSPYIMVAAGQKKESTTTDNKVTIDVTKVTTGTAPVPVPVSNAETQTSATIKVGDYFKMGTYYGDSILWRCVDVDENGPLMLSDKILTVKPFDASGNHKYLDNTVQADDSISSRTTKGSSLWETSNIRSWLNATANEGNVEWPDGCPPTDANVYEGNNDYAMEKGFLADGNFTTAERDYIKPVAQKSLLNYVDATKLSVGGTAIHAWGDTISTVLQNYDTAYYQTVTDKVFLLDVKQVTKVFQNLGSSYYIGQPTQKAVDHSEYKSSTCLAAGANADSCLRSPCANDTYTNTIRYVAKDGTIQHSYVNEFFGVRPAFYLNLIDGRFKNGSDGSEGKPFVLAGVTP